MIHESSSSASLEPYSGKRKPLGNEHLGVSPGGSLRFRSSRNTVGPVTSLQVASGSGAPVLGTSHDVDGGGSASKMHKQ